MAKVDEAEGLPLILQDGSTRYITGPDGLPLEQVTSSGVLYYDQDQLGSTRGLLDQSGNTVATYTYDAYGTVTSQTGNVANPFQYAGQYTDAESGLQYLRARYYDPATAQFLSVDPLVGLTHQPHSYAGDDPVNLVDPMGLCPARAAGQCTHEGGVKGWLLDHSGFLTLGIGIVIVIAIALGPEEVATAAGIAALVVSFAQVVVDMSQKHYLSAAEDIIGALLGLVGARVGLTALKYAWELKGYVWPIARSFASGNLVRGIMLLARALDLRDMQEMMDRRGLRYAGAALMAGIFAAVGGGEGCE